MRLGRWFSIPVRVHPATIPMFLAAIWLGEGRRMAIMSGCILFHELAHILAAKMLRVEVVELELMPIGGAARLENLWRLRAGQMTTVALAGPMCNCLLTVMAAALCWWGVLDPCLTAALIEQNMMIVCFNLLPALPMDGGRILCGWLGRRMSAAGAARVGASLSYGLAACLLGLSIYGVMRRHLNITLPAAALFLLMSARQEKRQAIVSMVDGMTGRLNRFDKEKTLPLRWIAVRDETMAYEAAMQLKPGFIHLLAVYDDEMKLHSVIEERELLTQLPKDSRRKMRNFSTTIQTLDYNIK